MGGARCLGCGCTPEERCALTVRQAAAGRPALQPGIRYGQTVPQDVCTLHRAPGGWLCTRCIRPDRMTTGQIGEVERILARKPDEARAAAMVVRGQRLGHLVLYASRTICADLRP